VLVDARRMSDLAQAAAQLLRRVGIRVVMDPPLRPHDDDIEAFHGAAHTSAARPMTGPPAGNGGIAGGTGSVPVRVAGGTGVGFIGALSPTR
ncbi:MAG: hypothetical protein ACREX7_02690, partial [Casimicrobiaceae bacterium]